MINSKKDLEEYLKADNNWYQPVTLKDKFIDKIAHYPWRSIKKYLFFCGNMNIITIQQEIIL